MKERIAEILRFGVVGGLGFLTDGGLLTGLTALAGWAPLPARLVSFPVALTVTWLLNRAWTFAPHAGGNPHRQYVLYTIVQVTGAALNFAVYTGLLQLGGAVYRWPVIALAGGSVVAMAFNYEVSRRFVFGAPAGKS